MSSSETPVLGIDLGTRYAVGALCWGDSSPVVVPHRWGGERTPSYVAWHEGRWITGEDAFRLSLKEPGRAWWNVKRFVGSSSWRVTVEGRTFAAEDLLVPLLATLREDAEAFAGTFLTSCVLAVPAHFGFPERAAMARTARGAGFDQVRIVNEPTAAALATGVEGRSLVLDFGAGTTDVTVVERDGAVWHVVESQGRGDLGGVDLDRALADHLWRSTFSGRLREDDPRRALLMNDAERIKIALSDSRRTPWYPPGGLGAPPEGSVDVSREAFEALARRLLLEVLSMVRRLWSCHNPHHLVLVGGGSRIPLLRQMLAEQVAEPARFRTSPDEAVALGTALYACQSGQRLLIDVLSASLGVEAADGNVVTLLERGTPLPCAASRRFASVKGGGVSVPVVEASGRARRRLLGTVRVSDVGEGDEVEVRFEVDGGGVLHVHVKLRGMVVRHEVLDVAPGASPAAEDRDLAELERRFSRLSLHLSPEQQERVASLLWRARSLGGEAADVLARDDALGILSELAHELERAVQRP